MELVPFVSGVKEKPTGRPKLFRGVPATHFFILRFGSFHGEADCHRDHVQCCHGGLFARGPKMQLANVQRCTLRSQQLSAGIHTPPSWNDAWPTGVFRTPVVWIPGSHKISMGKKHINLKAMGLIGPDRQTEVPFSSCPGETPGFLKLHYLQRNLLWL